MAEDITRHLDVIRDREPAKPRSITLLNRAQQPSLLDERSKQMDSSVQTCRSQLKPLIVALTLALPSAALAAPADVVGTRADQNIDQQYGRDSVYAFSTDSKPLTPERTSGSHWFHNWFHKSNASSSNPSGLYEGYVPKQQQESMALNAGSGYTGSETSQADIIAQPTSDVALGGEAQGQWTSESVIVMPLVSDSNTSGLYEGYVPKQQQESMALNAGSGYTGSETSQADTIAQPTSDLALGGEGQAQWTSESVMVMPLVSEETPEPVALNDGTATQFDRGYYQDPDQSDIILIIPDNVAMTGDQSGSAERQGALGGTE